MICLKCNGMGYHVTHKHKTFDTDNKWDIKYFNGEKYRFTLCRECYGTGEV